MTIWPLDHMTTQPHNHTTTQPQINDTCVKWTTNLLKTCKHKHNISEITSVFKQDIELVFVIVHYFLHCVFYIPCRRGNLVVWRFGPCMVPSFLSWYNYLAPGGGCEVLFSPGMSVCVCVSVCPANILIFYFSATRRYIDLKLIQDTYRVVLDSLKKLPS